jgi:hypothetical protein
MGAAQTTANRQLDHGRRRNAIIFLNYAKRLPVAHPDLRRARSTGFAGNAET